MKHILSHSLGVLLAGSAFAQATSTGPSTLSSPYLLPTVPGFQITSLLTVDNTGAVMDDLVGGTYGFNGIPDGLGAYDNGDGTFTVLANHELGGGVGVVRAHGSTGAYVSELVVNKNTLQVISGSDLIRTVFSWSTANQATGAVLPNAQFFRFCSADLPAPGAFFNAATGLGTTARIFLNGEEDTTHGWAMAHVATGASKGNSYILGKFNLTTNGSGLTGLGAWENLLASPFAQDATVVIGTNDGGTGIMNGSVSVYVGTKQSTGTEVEKAGLMNGTLTFISVAGNPVEITNNTTRATGITSGTRFSLSPTASTVFSRPEDGAWNPLNPRQFYFVTTDRRDDVTAGLGAQIGQSRLWRLTFDDISNPSLGGVIDLLIDGRVVDGQKINMMDNMCVNETSGLVLLQEDVGGTAQNGKMWEYNPATDSLRIIAKHDPARFGDRANGVTTAASAPYSNDEESTGAVDITAIMRGSALHKGNPREAWYLLADQAHYMTGITAAQVEGGQLLLMHDIAPQNNLTVTRGGFALNRRDGLYVQQITLTNNTGGPLQGPFHLVVDGLSANATLTNASGTTSVYTPLAAPFTTSESKATTLAPGASAKVTLSFSNPSNAVITYSTRVLNSIATP